MTLGIFSDDFLPFSGGMGRYLVEVTRRLPEARHLVFSPCDNRIPNHIQVRPAFHDSLHNISFSIWLHRAVDRLIDRYALTRINIQCGPGGIFLLKKIRVPVVATCYHTWWQQSHYIPAQFWKRVFIPFERRTYQRADRVICISEDSRDILAKKYRIPPDKLAVITPGVDTRQFFPMPEIKKRRNSLLYVGRVDRRKGVDFLIRAMPEVARQIPDVTLYVGGTGKDLPLLKNFVRAQSLERNVEFLGFIPENSLNTWYNQVQCAIAPSVFEGFGLTVVEAMAAGTSVISTRVDSIRRIVRDGTCGYLVDYGDTAALARRVVDLLGDEATRAKFVEEGLKQVRSLFSWEAVMDKLAPELLGG
jgi:glycosyltransferase involved in cell wall biosynthesis